MAQAVTVIQGTAESGVCVQVKAVNLSPLNKGLVHYLLSTFTSTGLVGIRKWFTSHSKFSDSLPCFGGIFGRNFLSSCKLFFISLPKYSLNYLSLCSESTVQLWCKDNYSCSDDNLFVIKSKFTFPIFFASRRSHQSGIPSTVCQSILYLQHFPQELLLPPRVSLVGAFSRQCWRCVLLQICSLFLLMYVWKHFPVNIIISLHYTIFIK